MKEIADEHRPTVCKKISRECGYTGLSILHRLHKLYGFDVIKVIVVDVMHNISLNFVGRISKTCLLMKILTRKQPMKDLQSFPGQQVNLISELTLYYHHADFFMAPPLH